MTSDVEIDRALATVTETVNEQRLSEFDVGRVREIVAEALGGQPSLTVDDGGGLHDDSGARVGALRRTGSGEWIAERQNDTAPGSDTAMPTQPPWSRMRELLTKLHVRG